MTQESKSKKADTVLKINELIAKRWSPRAFDPEKKVSKTQIEQLLTAASWAASSYNDQPWRFIVGTHPDDENYQKIMRSLWEFNQDWAKTAPVLMVICGNTISDQTGKQNTHYAYDCGQSIANLSIQATEMGLFVHQMAGFKPEEIEKSFDLPKEIKPLTALAIGYQGDANDIPKELQEGEKAERQRKPLEDLIIGGLK